MLSILERINQFLWGLPLLLLLAGSHLYFTIRLRFPQKLTLKAIRLSVTPEREDGSGHGTSRRNNAKEESLREMFHRIDSHHF